MKPKTTLHELTAQANALHQQAHAAQNSAIRFAKQAGEVLLKIKSRLNKHGSWLHWLEHNFEASSETANHYMRIAKHWPSLEKFVAENPSLSMIGALRILRKPKYAHPAPIESAHFMEALMQEREEEIRIEREYKRAIVKLGRAFMRAVARFPEELVCYLVRGHIIFDRFSDDFMERCIDPIRNHYEPLALPFLEAEAATKTVVPPCPRGHVQVRTVRLSQKA